MNLGLLFVIDGLEFDVFEVVVVVVMGDVVV